MYELSGRPQFDDRDEQIRVARQAALDKVTGPRVGDYVEFACGTKCRVSHVWDFEPVTVQTSDEGSWYLGDGYVSFSGSLRRGVPLETLKLTDERRPGLVWFFHHDFRQAHHGVDATIEFRVYQCTEVAPS